MSHKLKEKGSGISCSLLRVSEYQSLSGYNPISTDAHFNSILTPIQYKVISRDYFPLT